MTTDLLGDPLPVTPSMTDPLPWRVFRLNDCEWWMARTLDEAKADAAAEWGYTLEAAEAEGLFDDPCELPDEALDRLKFIDDFVSPAVKRSFREELERRSATDPKPQLFAASEW